MKKNESSHGLRDDTGSFLDAHVDTHAHNMYSVENESVTKNRQLFYFPPFFW